MKLSLFVLAAFMLFLCGCDSNAPRPVVFAKDKPWPEEISKQAQDKLFDEIDVILQKRHLGMACEVLSASSYICFVDDIRPGSRCSPSWVVRGSTKGETLKGMLLELQRSPNGMPPVIDMPGAPAEMRQEAERQMAEPCSGGGVKK